MNLRVLDIVRGTTVDGRGFRTSIYLAGCTHACEGCHNPQSWDFGGGKEMTLEEIMAIVREENFNVTLSGGDPMCSAAAVLPLARAVRDAGKSLWIYTGFLWEDLIADSDMRDLAELAEVVVDGPFLLSLRNPDLLFRGSSNQRLIDVALSFRAGKAVEWYPH